VASSGSYTRGDQSRSVPDRDERLHREAARRQQAYNERQEAAIARKRPRPTSFPDVGHPNEVEALIPVWGAGREALADAHDGDWLGAVGNGVMAVTDIVPAKSGRRSDPEGGCEGRRFSRLAHETLGESPGRAPMAWRKGLPQARRARASLANSQERLGQRRSGLDQEPTVERHRERSRDPWPYSWELHCGWCEAATLRSRRTRDQRDTGVGQGSPGYYAGRRRQIL
jgi:hypothetical protein